LDIADLGPDLRILEVGVFTGVVSVTLARLGYLVSASDVPLVVSDPALECFLRSEKIESCAVNLATTKLPYPDGSFDVIIFHSVLTHLNVNPIPILREFHRVLGENGVVYCNTPNLLAAKNVWRMLSGKGYLDPIERLAMNLNSKSGMSVGLHWREWTKAELIDLFEYCGFELESHRFAVTTPNRSKFPRKQLVGLMYAIRPAFMTTQIGLFRKAGATSRL
jgi:SAM-dependent methyltransferase